MWPFVLFALFLTVFLCAALFAICFLALTLTEKQAAMLELFKARSLEEAVILTDQKEAAKESRKAAMEELKEIAKQPKASTLAQTTNGRFIDTAHLVPDFQE